MSKVAYLSGAPRLSTRPNAESLGPRAHILGVIGALRREGHDVDVFVVGDSVAEGFSAAGSEARISGARWRTLATDAMRLGYRAKSRATVRKRWKQGPPSIAYERYALMQELGSVLSKRGAFWVLEVNALLAVESTSDRRTTTSRSLAEWFERRTMRRADLIVAVTARLGDEIVRKYGVSAAAVVVVANGVDVVAVAPERTPHAQPAGDAPRIGFLGALYPWQNLDLLIAALSEPELDGFVLDIAGSGPELADLRRRVDDAGLGDRVTFVGRVDPTMVPQFLANCDLCFAGHGTGGGEAYFSPLKLWEYLAAGVPVVSSDHAVVRDLHRQGYPVHLFHMDVPGELASAILSARAQGSDPGYSRPQVSARIAAEHSWDARVRGLLGEIAARRERRWQLRTPLKCGLGEVTPMTAREVCDLIAQGRTGPGSVIANLNLHGTYLAQSDAEYAAFLSQSTHVLVDGWPILKLTKGARRSSSYRVGSTDWMTMLFADDPDLKVVAIGGTPEVAERMREYVAATCRRLTWVHFDGYSGHAEGSGSPALRDALDSADLVVVGMGMPLQEQAIERLRTQSSTAIWANVGGCFDYFVGEQRLAPRFLGAIGLEWLFRLAHQPRRLARRYLVEPWQLSWLVARNHLGRGRRSR